jgi:hypothetical protein
LLCHVFPCIITLHCFLCSWCHIFSAHNMFHACIPLFLVLCVAMWKSNSLFLCVFESAWKHLLFFACLLIY